MRVFIRFAMLIVFIFGLAAAAGAEEFEYKEYEVQKGDTLWDISEQELADPFNWPIVWRANPDIENPDWIEPGQKIRIPVSLLKQTEIGLVKRREKPAKAAPAVEKPKEPVAVPVDISADIREISKYDILRGGYITMQPPYAGEIVGSPGRRILVGEDDEVYIKGVEPLKVGDKFYVVRNAAKVEHPVLPRTLVGYQIRVLGIVEVEKVGKADVTARIIKGFGGIEVGDLLDRYYEVEPVFLTGEARTPELKAGVVVAATHMRLLNGMLDVVYIDRGRNDGLKAGDMVATLAPGTPDRPNGLLSVISTRDTTSTLVVLKGVLDVSIGHDVVSCSQVDGCAAN
jgi:hypothetical protein